MLGVRRIFTGHPPTWPVNISDSNSLLPVLRLGPNFLPCEAVTQLMSGKLRLRETTQLLIRGGEHLGMGAI